MRRAVRSTHVLGFLAVTIAIAVSAAPARAVPATPAFRVPTPTGASPMAVAAGDLNGDGNADVVAVNYASNTVSVLLSTGAVGFLPKVDYSAPAGPADVELADFDGDGRLDLVVAASGANQISLRLGNGAGGFGPRVESAAHGTAPRGLAVADMNLDGRLDLVVCNLGTNSVSVFLGDGAGGFTQRIDRGVPGGPHGVAVGDYDGDGIPDVVTANLFANNVQFLSGTGTGTLLEYATVPVGAGPMAIAMADIDQDGGLDIVTANNGSNSVSVITVNPPGIGSTVSHAVGFGPADVAFAVSPNGRTTLFVANYYSTSFSLLEFTSAGTLLANSEYVTGFDPSGIVAIDVDHDGVLEAVTADQGAGTVSMIRPIGIPLYSSPKIMTPSPAYAPAVADLDGDGNLDVVIPNFTGIAVSLGRGDGTFEPALQIPAGASGGTPKFGHVDDDGRLDMAVPIGGGVHVCLGNGQGGFGAATTLSTGATIAAIALVDLNVDGRLDVIAANSGATAVSVFLGTGAGAFGPRTDFATGGQCSGLAVGHFNGDVFLDVVVSRSASSSVAFLAGVGNGALQAPVSFAAGSTPASIAAGDVDGNGTLDLVVVNYAFSSSSYSLLSGNGAGSFAPPSSFGTSLGGAIALLDWSLDGRLDLVSPEGVWLGNGLGLFFPRTDNVPGGDAGLAIGDLSNDGRPDLVLGRTDVSFPGVWVLLSPAATEIALSAPPLAVTGQPFTLTATVTSAGTLPTNGVVRFFDGTTLLGSATVASGTAALSAFAGALGDRRLHAVLESNGRSTAAFSNVVPRRVVATAKPSIASISDVKNDQGGRVRLRFMASPYDYLGSATPIMGYSVYRRVNDANGIASSRGPGPAAVRSAVPVAGPDAAMILGWDFVTSVPANAEPGYEVVVATLADSNASGDHDAAFFVRAATATPAVFYDSAADSGHSVDNLPPAPPAAFLAAYVGGATHLHWSASPEPDLWYYTLHRGTSAGFTPGPGNVVATPPDTGYADPGAAGGYYKLAAVDVNGNVSGYTLLSPGGTLAAGDAAVAFALEGARPNPATGGRLSVAFALPSGAPAQLELMDAAGRRVASREVGGFGAGRHVVDLGRDARVAPGVYLLRLVQGEANRVQRVLVMR